MDYVRNIEDIAKDMDAGIMTADFQHTDGICLDGDKGKLIIIDEKLDPYHRRWAIAHELGHIEDDTIQSAYSLIAERRASENAVNMLISDADFISALEEYGGDYAYLCGMFGVSQDVIERKYRQVFPERFTM